jgi:hypothetical protein
MAAVAAFAFPILIVSGCGGNTGTSTPTKKAQLGPADGYDYSIDTLNCSSTLEITDESGGFTGAGYVVVYTAVNLDGDPTGGSYTDKSPMLLGGKIDTFIKSGTPAGIYEVNVEEGNVVYPTGYIQFTGC